MRHQARTERTGRARYISATAALALVVTVFGSTPAHATERAVRPVVVASPSCSTAVRAAPVLPGGTTSQSPTTYPQPFGVVVSRDGKFAFIADGPGLLVYSLHGPAPKLVTDVPANVSPLFGLSLSRDGTILVAAGGSGMAFFAVSDLERGQAGADAAEVGEVSSPHSGGAIEAAVAPDGHHAFVTEETSDQVAVFGGLSDSRAKNRAELLGTIPTGVAPVGMAVSPNGRYLYVTSEAMKASPSQLQSQVGTLTTIDLSKAERTPAHAVVSVVRAGCNPVRVVASPDGRWVYVTARASDDVLEFSAQQLVVHPSTALAGVVRVGVAPVGLALANHGSTLVVADSNRFGASGAQSSLAVVTISAGGQMALAGYLPAGGFPRDMAVSPDGRTVFVCNYATSQLEVVNAAQLP
jgi:DNA-binding beta-propeller fold protein YncE